MCHDNQGMGLKRKATLPQEVRQTYSVNDQGQIERTESSRDGSPHASWRDADIFVTKTDGKARHAQIDCTSVSIEALRLILEMTEREFVAFTRTERVQ